MITVVITGVVKRGVLSMAILVVFAMDFGSGEVQQASAADAMSLSKG